MGPVIKVSAIRKTYGSTVAVDDLSFEVNEGEIFGLIGPNGAGKTTTMECIEGLRTPDKGAISVLGLDPFNDVYKLQERIGVQLQQAQLQKRIKVWEAVDLWASLYQKNAIDGERLLEQLGLIDKRNAWFMTLSGGQKQRLFIALALINDPALVFLDELTTGLDPQARHLGLGARNPRARKTVFLTTHLMEEAERLCDRVAIIEHGRIIDIDSPESLVKRHCPERTVILAAPAAKRNLARHDPRLPRSRGCQNDSNLREGKSGNETKRTRKNYRVFASPGDSMLAAEQGPPRLAPFVVTLRRTCAYANPEPSSANRTRCPDIMLSPPMRAPRPAAS
jgi:ABC-2 type transport system ATP-binding protein